MPSNANGTPGGNEGRSLGSIVSEEERNRLHQERPAIVLAFSSMRESWPDAISASSRSLLSPYVSACESFP